MKIPEAKYKQYLEEESKFWGTTDYKEPSSKIKRLIKKILTKIGLQGETNIFDIRKGLSFKPHIIIWGKDNMKDIFEIGSKYMNVLEIGCGHGWLSIELARRNKNISIDSLDVSSEAIKEGKEYYEKLSKKEKIGKINFRVQDLNYIKLPEKKYDVVIAFATLHHIMNINSLIKEIKKSLKTQGYFIAYEDNGLNKNDKRKLTLMFFPFLLLKRIINKTSLKWKNFEDEIDKMYDWATLRESPFEGIIKGESIIGEIEKNFKIIKKRENRCLIDGILRSAPLPIMRLFVVPIKFIDNLCLYFKILSEGRSIFIIGKNE
jgi:2-polyprenyl-3-methyl-5-hydroxy-6-metoxy-1,4-benzoquinol methylase